MRQTVVSLALLLCAMASFSLWAAGGAGTAPVASPSSGAPPRAHAVTPRSEPAVPSPSASSKAQGETLPPKEAEAANRAAADTQTLSVSAVASLTEPVLLYDSASGRVLTLSQQEYILGAVCSEMPPQFHIEAIKSQAVAAHTYLLRCKAQEEKSPNPALKGAYLSVNTQKREGYVSQATVRTMYGEQFDIWYPSIKEAVAQVANEILIYEEMPIVAAYHSISAGLTEGAEHVWSGSADYLVPVESPGDRLAPNYKSVSTFSKDEVAAALQTLAPDIALPEEPGEWFAALTRSPSGYVTSLQIGEIQIPGQKLRFALGLRSSNLAIDCQDDTFTFTATGYGHGVGLSQYGADYMGRQGSGYREILTHYYPGSQLVQIQ